MKRDDTVTLLDLLNAAGLIEEFVSGSNRASFLKDRMRRSAVLHQILVLGGAVKRLSMEFRTNHTDIPWSAIVTMRDRLIHGYDVINYRNVWKTATAEIPDLSKRLKPLLPKKP